MLAVAIVIASGTALLVMALSSLTSLLVTADAYHERYRFAEVFAGVKRAPERVVTRIAAIPGVQTVETRVEAFATVSLPGVAEPITATLVSLPDRGGPLLNRPAQLTGTFPGDQATGEALLLAPFAEENGLGPGDTIGVLLNGVRREIRIAGTALSPEFVYTLPQGGIMPDAAHFGVIWMRRAALATAYDLDGTFNDVTLALLPDASPDPVIEALDPLLERYGGTGAIARADQISNWFLVNEFKQLRTTAVLLPTVFLSVAVFLTCTLLGRLIATERREISLLKAFGYSEMQIGAHYAKIGLAIAALGVLAGWALGAALGRFNTASYSEFFSFPFLYCRPAVSVFALSVAIGLGTALLGALTAVRAAVTLPPAEAMRPPAPEAFRGAGMPEALAARFDSPTRMILRRIARSPARSAVTATGVAFAMGVLITALQWPASIDRLATVHFETSQHQDMVIGFHDLRDADAARTLARLPGVLTVEPQRSVAARLSHGGRRHRGALTGLPAGARLQVIHDVRGWDVDVPPGGVVLGTVLAEKLGVTPGDRIEVETLAGVKRSFSLPVAAVFETFIGTPAYLDLVTLNRAMGDGAALAQASLLVDTDAEDALFRAVREMPGVSSLTVKHRSIEAMFETLGETIMIFTSFFVFFAAALAGSVVYNAAFIALSERGRELATLRLLGFTRWEISYILLGEIALLVIAALPLGCLAGYGLARLMTASFATELFRVPYVFQPSAYGWAALVVLGACLLSGALVRRRLDRLDLVAVLKTR